MEAEEYLETSLCPQILKFVNISDQIHYVYQLKQSSYIPSYNLLQPATFDMAFIKWSAVTHQLYRAFFDRYERGKVEMALWITRWSRNPATAVRLRFEPQSALTFFLLALYFRLTSAYPSA